MLFTFTLSCIFFLGFGWVLRRLAFDGRSMLILLSAAALSLSYFLHSSWPLFNHDAWMHVNYVESLALGKGFPHMSENGAARHSPVYYFFAAGFYTLGQLFGVADPRDAARFASLVLFWTFWVFAALTLRQLLPARSHAYYIALALLAFWPVGITKVGAVHCDLLLYAGEMATLYFLLVWFTQKSARHLSLAFAACGVALLAKNSAILLLALCVAVWLWALWREPAHRAPLLAPRQWLAIGFAAACALFTFSFAQRNGHVPIYAPHTFSNADYLGMYFYFNPLEFLADTMINPHTGEAPTHFWHYFLRSLLVGDYIYWKALAVLFAFGFVWMALLVYVFAGLWRLRQASALEKNIALFLLGYCALRVGPLLYLFQAMPHPTQIADGRYVYPLIVVICLFFAQAQAWHAAQGRLLWVRLGNGLVLGFMLLTLCLFIAQDYLLTKIQ